LGDIGGESEGGKKGERKEGERGGGNSVILIVQLKRFFKLFIFTFIFSSFITWPFIHFYYSSNSYETYSARKEAKPIIINESNGQQIVPIEDLKIFFPPKHSFISSSIKAEEINKSLIDGGLPKDTSVILRDEKYSFVSISYFDKYSKWWLALIQNNNFKFESDAFDCDNFSDTFMILFQLSSKLFDLKVKAQLACGTVIVENTAEFAGIPAGENSWHSLNIVMTDYGWFVIEPQNGVYISLNSYPNKNNIKLIIF